MCTIADHFSRSVASPLVPRARLLQARGEMLSILLMRKIERCFEKEHAYHLTRPEIARYVVETTKELAELLGIFLAEERGESED